VSFAAITLCVASQRVFIFVVIVVYFIDSVRKLFDIPSMRVPVVSPEMRVGSFFKHASFGLSRVLFAVTLHQCFTTATGCYSFDLHKGQDKPLNLKRRA
jgi:hypothetical protein